ncbi:outer membrane protein assembly factor BamE [Geothrix sp.]|uniref:outer membrane protein assembly factor BamE domain-containing protein n=1 Tax=Geothrix sp. TaxID=1962974 RepID=UPI0025BFE311|nr:outer membrane protein assembly factor BamE [Geothrix sp.]
MQRRLAALMIAIPAVVSLGCTKPDLDVSKLRVGMTKKEVIERVGNPTRTKVTNDTEVHEYEAYDRYGAIKVNSRTQYIRFVNGRVDAFGTLEDLKAGRSSWNSPEARAKVNPEMREAAPLKQPATPAGPAFDLRVELEKLEKLKKDGLITEVEFRELRQKVMDKARAQ